MTAAPSPWQVTLARIEGALPFISSELAEGLALASLRRLWRVHVRDFWFDTIGLEHNPGIEADELMRSWFAEERRDLLSWVARRGPPPLARAARLALAAKGVSESFASGYVVADRALERLDALLPAPDPIAALTALVEQLRSDEIDFLESGSEIQEFAGATFDRPAPRGASWAASLAVAMRPHLFGLGSAPFALAGLAPRSVFRSQPESPLPILLDQVIGASTRQTSEDLMRLRQAQGQVAAKLETLYASSRAPDVWMLVSALGPLTRAELSRALGITKRTASMGVTSLARAGLVRLRAADNAVIVAAI